MCLGNLLLAVRAAAAGPASRGVCVVHRVPFCQWLGHDAEHCWTIPASPEYRPEFVVPAAMADNAKGKAGVGGSDAAGVGSRVELGDAVWAARSVFSALAAHAGFKAVGCALGGHTELMVLDTGESYHMAPPERVLLNASRWIPGGGIRLHTAAGLRWFI